MENKNLVFGVVGILVGALITGGLFLYGTERDMGHQYSETMNMEGAMHGMTTGLEGKTGDAFDKKFLAEMIVHHQGAVEMAQAVLATSKRPELIQLAHDIITAQTKEIGMMQDWQKTWFK